MYDEEEVEIMIKYILEHKEIRNLAILLMFVTGMRVGELVTLKSSDFSGNTITIRRTESKIPAGKGKYDYIVKDFPKSEAGVRTIVVPSSYQWLMDLLKKRIGEFFFGGGSSVHDKCN